MSPQALLIKTLSVSKMPGFSDGLRITKKFSGQLNIITGPNASGKSSVARAIQKVIWSENTRDYWLKAEAEVGSDQWVFDVNHGFSEAQRNGHKQRFQGPVAEGSQRYLLALHELVKAEDAELAEEIHRQLSGGYDLDAAARSAEFGRSINTKSLKQYKELDAARKKVKELTNDQKHLLAEQDRLQDLRNELNRKNQELQKERLFEFALQYRKTSLEKESAEAHLQSFPAELKRLDKDDLSNVESCETEISDAEKEIATAKSELERLSEEMKQLGLPDAGLSDAQSDRMAASLIEIEMLTKSEQDLNSEILRADVALKNAATNLQLKSPQAEWSGLKTDAVKPLEEAWQNAYQQFAIQTALEKEIETLQNRLDTLPNDASDRDELLLGIKNLTRWLQEHQGQRDREIPQWSLFALSVLAIAGAFVALFVNWIGLGVAALVAVILFLALRKNNTALSGNAAETYKRDFEKSGLSGPSTWNSEDVVAHIGILTAQLQIASEKSAVKDQISRRFDEHKKVNADLEKFRSVLDENRDALALSPVNDDSQSLSGMYWFLFNASKWQEARDARDGAKAELRKVEDILDARLETFNETLKDLQCRAINDFSTARTILDRLRRDEQKRRDAEHRIRIARSSETNKNNECDKLHKKIDAVYERLQIAGSNKHQLQVLHHQLEAFKEAEKQQDRLARKAADNERELREHSFYESEKENLSALSREELEQRIGEFSDFRVRRDQLIGEIGSIEGRVDAHKKKHDLESALNEADAASEDLELAFEENLLQYTGQVVVDALRSAHHDQNDSQLYKRADELFRTITRQRFSLLVPDGSEKAFRAFDEVKRIGLGLSQLSTGTRIQLLLAVRLAYIETQEQNYSLPLLADELLANSDDVRAQAIIEALVEISKAGRQVFYFTAQNDEVNKWQQYLSENPEVDYQLISLESAEGKAVNFDDFETVKATNGLDALQKPQSMNHQQYGEAIQVPHFELMSHPIERLHLWYLLDDVTLLYELLRNQVRYWGQLKTLEQTPPAFAPENWSTVFDRINRRINLVKQLQKLYQRGRPKPIDRSALLNSGAISDSFIDAVGELLEQVNGNPEQLLFSLENRAVTGFRSNKIDDLRGFFEREGFLSGDEEPISEDALMEQLYAAATGLHLDVADVQDMKRRILGRGFN